MADKPVRVLLVVGETAGGIGRHVALLAEHLGRYGVAAAVCGPGSALAAVGDPPGVGKALLDTARGRPDVVLSSRRRLCKLARGFEVVHAHGLRAGAVAAARPAHMPLVVTWHNAPLVGGLTGRLHSLLERYVARSASLTLGASADLTAAAVRAGARTASTTFVVAPPLAPATRSRADVRAELGAGSQPVVLAVGRLQAQKRFDVLVAAAGRWVGGEADPIVVIAGDGPDDAQLRAEIDRTTAPVRLLGARADVADLLRAADVVALPSVWEARSLVAQEAMRAGVPLVTTPVGALPELVGDGGLFVPVGDAQALGDALDRVLAEPDLAARLGSQGKARSAGWPTVERAVEELAATYRDLIGRRR
ncbi:MAG TPA: glycosyltransferase family 4 protein [Mycobacteriales bacterium]|jgi:glycosyltransferase involved in cell wall biosynthesis|nr:glycosyltransferase family 4 protein [Mycobacteriales bacterium]